MEGPFALFCRMSVCISAYIAGYFDIIHRCQISGYAARALHDEHFLITSLTQ